MRALLDVRALDASDEDVERVREFVLAFVESELCRRLAASEAPRRELPFLFTLDALLVNGFVDVHAMEGTTALVVDYKTDPVGPDGPGPVAERDYAVQRLVYALAALKAGAERVEVVHLFLERPGEPAVAVYDAADMPALEQQLREVSADLVNWEFEPTHQPHRGLCLTCAARPGLCSWEPERTLLGPRLYGDWMSEQPLTDRPQVGIEGFPGPFAVGRYATGFRGFLAAARGSA